jgi:hypothetical protein
MCAKVLMLLGSSLKLAGVNPHPLSYGTKWGLQTIAAFRVPEGVGVVPSEAM